MTLQHGGNLRELARRAGLAEDQVLDFSASINPLGPPDCLRAAVSRAVERLEHYPDPEGADLVRAIADRYRLATEQIVIGNGSTELLFAAAHLVLPFPLAGGLQFLPSPLAGEGSGVRVSGRKMPNCAGVASSSPHPSPLSEGEGDPSFDRPDSLTEHSTGRVMVPVPSYIDYITAIRAAGGAVERLLLRESEQFALDWPRLAQRAGGAAAVFLGQPNNPTGLMFDPQQLRTLAARHASTLFIVDEAFADFVDGYRSLAVDVPPNVVVLRSCTKFYAIPGLRLGFAVAQAEVARRLRRRLPPWTVNALAQAAGIAVLADEPYRRRTVELIATERQRLGERLAQLPGLYVYPSAANFLLLRLDRTDFNAHRLAERLLAQGIAVRVFDPAEHLDQRFLRVAVRGSEENERLCEALATILEPSREGENQVPLSLRERVGVRGVSNGSPTACRSPLQAPLPATPLPSRRERRAGEERFHPGRKKVPKVKTPAIMFQGTSSNAGKSLLTAALCRILLEDGVRVAPFKSQNMSLNSFVTRDGGEMGRAQVVQAQACRLEPDVRMNPILLKPNSDVGSQVIVRGKAVGNMSVAEYVRYKPQAFATAKACYDSLAAEFDAVVLEGAGSPGEVNLKSHDIVNMPMALYAGAPVLIVGDIDRGGVFASFVGTLEVLAAWERKLVAGWIVNRFRGDAALLAPALEYTHAHTGRPVLGVVPYLPNLNLPQEDSVEFKSGALDDSSANGRAVEIAVIDLPHLSNFTDFDPFRVENDVKLRIVRSADDLRQPDAVLIGGSKNTLADLEYLNRSGLGRRIRQLARGGKAEIVGICGGFQMLGCEIADPQAVESPSQASRGLGLLGGKTTMAAEKTLVRTSARHALAGLELVGYEIHHGRTVDAGAALLTAADGRTVGTTSPDHRIWGTYLHGVFDDDRFRRWFIDRLRVRRGLEAIGRVVGCYDIEPALDRLAAAVRESLPMETVYRLMGLR
ncbi:MAG: cobyric acid synthase [Thermoguttaceae bacterium]